MKVGIIGQGYVGLTLSLFACKAHEVIGFDLNSGLVSNLNSGISHVEGLSNSILQEAIKSNRYLATTNPNKLSDCSIIIIAVPTPLDENRKPDLTFIEKACDLISDNLKVDALIINESTSYPGTVRTLIKPKIENRSPGRNHLYAVSPERVDPGRVDWDQTNTPRLYSGLTNEASEKTREFYSTFCNNLVEVSSPEVAEAAKLFENTFRQVNIALVNEFSQISHALNIPVREVLDAANTKPYGFMKFNPSAGVGGHCIPVDPSYLADVAEKNGVKANFIELANKVNLQMGRYIVSRIKLDNSNDLRGKEVQIIGVAYKPNIADVRETPALQIWEELIKEGAIVSWHDPLVHTWQGQMSSPINANIAILVTPHDVILEQLRKDGKYIFDTTGKLKDATQL